MLKKIFFLILAASFTLTSDGSTGNSQGATWGVGLRFGDPTGITIKKYNISGKSFEFNFGGTTWRGYNYNDRFGSNFNAFNYTYLGINKRGAYSIQARVLISGEIEDAEGLQWYYGAGPQLRIKRYEYRYRYLSPNGFQIDEIEDATDLDIGVDGVLGLEYLFADAPISAFLDISMFIELVDDPFYFWPQGAIGARYNF